MSFNQPMAWTLFFILVGAALTLDLTVLARHKSKPSLKSSLGWTAFWISLAASFALMLWYQAGTAVAAKFTAAYVLELSLSVDNLFVFLVIFGHYKVPEAYQRKTLLWGIAGALVLRAIFIGAGAAAIHRWDWLLVAFGAFLIYTSIRLLMHKNETIDPAKSPIVRVAGYFFKIKPHYEGDRFFVRERGEIWLTPLFIVLMIVEATDVVFAVDSIPAVFGISTDPFIVYTSNIFAILGLRALFFVLEGVLHLFRFLKVGLAVILCLIGLKLLLLPTLEARFGFHAGEYWILGMIGFILAASILASLAFKAPAKRR